MTQKPRSVHPTRAERLLYPIREFLHQEASSGILLLVCTVVALIWANSPWAAAYTTVWETKFTIGYGEFSLSKALLLWINDGLMAIFFFVVGLEIKREIMVGELASPRQAALPIAAALGGMVAPALLYVLFNWGGAGAAGWGIPMATDIAFAIGVLALLGARAPLSLKIFLTALAIVDDMGAVLVIAIFYTADLAWIYLLWAAGIYVMLFVANRLEVRTPLVYTLLGIALWFTFLKSGVHATIAGVLLAMMIPARERINSRDFLARSRSLLQQFEQAGAGAGGSMLTNQGQQAALQELENAFEHAQAPLQRLEHQLHPWVAYVIMPIFALANAGVAISGDLITLLIHPVTAGVAFGLVIGKQVGVTLATWLAVRSGLTTLPTGVTWRQIYGVSWLAGIGFTMSLFIAGLAFTDAALLTAAKLGILLASLVAGVVGWLLLSRTRPA